MPCEIDAHLRYIESTIGGERDERGEPQKLKNTPNSPCNIEVGLFQAFHTRVWFIGPHQQAVPFLGGRAIPIAGMVTANNSLRLIEIALDNHLEEFLKRRSSFGVASPRTMLRYHKSARLKTGIAQTIHVLRNRIYIYRHFDVYNI